MGRIDDCILTKDGRRIGRLDHIFKGVENIAEAQIVQNTLEEIWIRIVPFGTLTDKQRQKVLRNLEERLGKEMKVVIDVVAEIPRTKSGKFRAVICNVS